MSKVRQPVINGQVLREARFRKGWTLRDLAQECERLGTVVDYSNIRKAENGRQGAIGVRKLPALAQALEIEVEELMAA